MPDLPAPESKIRFFINSCMTKKIKKMLFAVALMIATIFTPTNTFNVQLSVCYQCTIIQSENVERTQQYASQLPELERIPVPETKPQR